MLKMILKDLRLSPLRSILTSVSMLVGIIAMIGSVLVGTLGREYLISVNAQVYGWSPTYSFVIAESDLHDRNKMEQLFQKMCIRDRCGRDRQDLRPVLIHSTVKSAGGPPPVLLRF